MTAPLFTKTFKVYFGDTDAAKVVYHGRYIYWLEATRIDWLASLGCPYSTIQKQNIGIIPVNININYLKPLHFEDKFHITLSLQNISKASITVESDVIKENQICCQATVKLACINEENWKPCPLPMILKKVL